MKINLYDKTANIGLTKILVERCIQQGEDCQEAARYLSFLLSLKEVEPSMLTSL